MAYIEGRIVHDADAHVTETPDWLDVVAQADVHDARRDARLSESTCHGTRSVKAPQL